MKKDDFLVLRWVIKALVYLTLGGLGVFIAAVFIGCLILYPIKTLAAILLTALALDLIRQGMHNYRSTREYNDAK